MVSLKIQPSKQNNVNHLLHDSENLPRRHKSGILWCVAGISLFLFFGFCLVWLYQNDRGYLFCRVTDKEHKVHATCSGIPTAEKFDCFPDRPVSEKECLNRGCCYQAVASPNPVGVPFCYYPSDYNGYSIYASSHDGRHIQARLKRNTSSGFPKDVSDLLLTVTLLDNNSVRVKITDSNAERFEVPIQINAELKDLTAPLYNVNIDSQNNLYVTRKTTGQTIFKTSLHRLVYSDQFLQLSSDLPSPYLYGIGENYGSMLRNVNWTRITLFNSDRQPIPNYPLYGSHPFYLSLEKDGSASGVFLLNSNAMDVILQPKPSITSRPIGGVLDFFIFLGPSPGDVVRQYTNVVGRTFMPPYWSLGFQLCRYGYNSLNKTKETLMRNIDAGIPIDVQWNDIDYMNRYKDFTYDEKNFAGLPDFVDQLHQKGMHYVIMTDPGVSNSEAPGTYPPYDEGVRDNIFLKNPNGSIFIGKVWNDGNTVFPDFSHPGAVTYWTRQFQNFYQKIKFDGVWIDMNEPSNFMDGSVDGCIQSSFEDPQYLPGSGENKLRRKTACMTSRHYNTIHYNEHNLVAYREAHATNQALRSVRKKRPFIISRASFAGQGVHSGHWSGDISSTWEDMRYTIPSTINFNLYGVSMIGSDICGFSRNTTSELCARWQSLGAFYPFSRNHNEHDTIEQDPVALGPTVVDATKNALTQRYWALPYLYTLFYRSHVFGDTVIRPTFFEFPGDKNTYNQDEVFLWGPAFMIIPALYPGVSKVTAYLPKGVWYTGATNMIVSSGSNFTFSSDNTTIVTAARGGCIFPCQISANTTTQSRENPFILAVALDANKQAFGELYWDDGDSLETFEKGEYNLIKFSAVKNVIKNDVVKNNYGGKMELTNIQLLGATPLPTKITFNGINCLKRSLSEVEKNELPQRKLSWMTRYFDNFVPVGATCVYTIVSDVAVAIGFTPTSLLQPFNVIWS